MDRQQILERLNKPQGASLATVDQGEPRVRGIQLYCADARGILFQTGPMKVMHRELTAHPMAELCVIFPEEWMQIRVRGEFHAIHDMALKEEVVNHPSRVYLEPWRKAVGDQEFFANITVFGMSREVTAQVWTMDTNFKPMAPIVLY